MNAKKLAEFIQSLDVKSVNTRKDYGSEFPQDLLEINLEKPIKVSVNYSEGFFSCICDALEMLSEDRTLDFMINGFLSCTIKTATIYQIKWQEANEEEYGAECEKFSALDYTY